MSGLSGIGILMRSPIWMDRDRRNEVTPECRQEIDKLNSIGDKLIDAYFDLVTSATIAPEMATTLMAQLTEAEVRWLLGLLVGYDAKQVEP